jgi:hypothetical protein
MKSKYSRVRSSPVEVEEARCQEENSQVTDNKRSKDTQISPSIAELIAKRLVEFIADLVCAISAHIGCVIQEVARRTTTKEVGHVVSAVLTLRCAELIELASVALDLAAVKFSDNHTANQACEGVEFVEPDTPKLGNLRLGDSDTTKEGEDDDNLRQLVCNRCAHVMSTYEGVNVGGDEGGGCQRCNGLAKCDGEHLGDENDEELISCARRSGVESRDIV